MAATTTTPTDDLTAEVTAWLEANWDPDLTVEEWWGRLGPSGWAVPTWPEEWYGKGLSRAEGVRVMQTISAYPALGAPGGLGTRPDLDQAPGFQLRKLSKARKDITSVVITVTDTFANTPAPGKENQLALTDAKFYGAPLG